MKDAREITQGKLWDSISRQDKRRIVESAHAINRDGTAASKEQTRARQQGK